MTSLRVETGCWFVEHQNLRLVYQTARDSETALHAARELIDFHIALLGELCELEKLFDLLFQEGTRETEVATVDIEVLPGLELAIVVVLLRHHTEVGANLWAMLVGVFAENGQVAAGALRGRGNHAHSGRLACPVWAEQAERLALLDLEVDAVDGHEVVVFLGEPARDNHRGFGLFSQLLAFVVESLNLWPSRAAFQDNP